MQFTQITAESALLKPSIITQYFANTHLTAAYAGRAPSIPPTMERHDDYNPSLITDVFSLFSFHIG
jgi:hypothetical protein